MRSAHTAPILLAFMLALHGACGGGGGPACAPEDDGNPCTDDVCEDGATVHRPAAAGSPCTGGGTRCDGKGTCVECVSAADCPGSDSACRTRTCDEGHCGKDDVAAGTVAAIQVPGDCKRDVCDGNGGTMSQDDDTDLPDDKNGCTADVCAQGVPSNPVEAEGAPCGDNMICDAGGQCVGCQSPSDCPGADDECQQRTCQEGMCGMTFTAASTPLVAQTPNDCLRRVCDGNGNATDVADDGDTPTDDGNPCTGEACNAGMPAHPKKADGTACDDGDACTQSDTCKSGACGGNPVVCTAQDDCHLAGTCDPSTGVCPSPSKADGAACKGDDGCIAGGACQTGVCTGVPNALFAAKVDHDAGPSPQGIAVADFNGDGKPDIIVANLSFNTLSVLLNNGNGTFAPRVTYATGVGPTAIAVGDFNADGKPDLAVTNQGANTVSVLLNSGNGTFAPRVDYATGTLPIGIAVADFNVDGRLDLAVTNHGSDTMSVLSGNGNGTFLPRVDVPTGDGPSGIVTADFIADGKPDIIVTNDNADTLTLLYNKGNGTFFQGLGIAGVSPARAVTADFDGDAKVDLAVTNYGADTVSVMLHSGGVTFTSTSEFATGSKPYGIATADWNGDGKPDLAVVNGSSNTLSVLLNLGDGTFAPKVDYGTGVSPSWAAAADVDGNGKPDVLVTNITDGTVSVFSNVGCP